MVLFSEHQVCQALNKKTTNIVDHLQLLTLHMKEVYLHTLVEGSLFVHTGGRKFICTHWWKEVYLYTLVEGSLFVQTGGRKFIFTHWWKEVYLYTLVEGSLFVHTGVILLFFLMHLTDGAHMIIRVDKCHTFGMKKVNTLSKQCQPKLYINNDQIPPVKNDESFKYLGRYFDYVK